MSQGGTGSGDGGSGNGGRIVAGVAVGLGLGSLGLILWKAWTKNQKAAVTLTSRGDDGDYSSLESLRVSSAVLKDLVRHMISEMELGLSGDPSSTLKMLPGFVGKPQGNEEGVFYALDLGGTNFRVIQLELKGGKIGTSNMKKFTIGKEAMEGTAEQLFGFIAECVQNFIGSQEQKGQATVLLGFTFSFPVQQTGIAAGTLISWTKGFTTQGVVGNDVVQLLNSAFQEKGINAKAIALANDTVGTMVARSYEDPKCEMGVILGTGTNACYLEHVANIKKDIGAYSSPSMVINMEWGAFGDGKSFLPLTKMDNIVDEQSKNPSKQRFEKIISGMYLGEIVRLTLSELAASGVISFFTQTAPYSFLTSYISLALNDPTPNLQQIQELIFNHFGVKDAPYKERALLKVVCEAVAYRAAKLSATAIGAVLSKIHRLKDTTVAVDGSVFEHIPGFKKVMEQTLLELFPESQVRLELTTDGSGNGAAIIASTVATHLDS